MGDTQQNQEQQGQSSPPEGNGNGGEGQQNQQTQSAAQPVSREEFEELKSLLESRVDNAFRGAQSYADKVTNNAKTAVEQSVEERLSQFRDTAARLGAQISPEQEAELRRDLRLEEMDKRIDSLSQEPETSGPNKPVLQNASDNQKKLVEDMAKDLEKTYGVELLPDDPEFARVKTDGTPIEYLKSTEEQLKAKLQRRQGARSRIPPQQTGDEPNPIRDVTDPNELWDKSFGDPDYLNT